MKRASPRKGVFLQQGSIRYTNLGSTAELQRSKIAVDSDEPAGRGLSG
jgi:hypothetical protein